MDIYCFIRKKIYKIKVSNEEIKQIASEELFDRVIEGELKGISLSELNKKIVENKK